MSDHQPKEKEVVTEEKKEEPKPSSNKRKAEVETDEEVEEEENEELEAEAIVPDPKRQKEFDPNDFETITDAADALANSAVLRELSKPDLLSRFAIRHGSHSKELHTSVYNAAAALMDSAVTLMQLAEVMLASRWLRSGLPPANFMPRDKYAICDDPFKALERGVAILLIGLAGQRAPDIKFDIPPDAAVPLDTGVLTLLVNKTSVERLLWFWVDVTAEFETLVLHRRIRDVNRAHEFTEFVRRKLNEDLGFKVDHKSRGYSDLSRVRRVLAAVTSPKKMPGVKDLMQAVK